MTRSQRNISPTLRRQRLVKEFRRLRDSTGRRLLDVAAETGVSKSRLQRIEVGRMSTIRAEDVDALMDFYEVADQSAREAMHALARDSNEQGWWTRYRDVFGDPALPDLENEAGVIRTFESQAVPPLLQTPEYAQAVLWRLDPETGRRHVDARMERQQVLTRLYPPEYTAVIDEAVLRRPAGSGAVLKDQLAHLLHMAERPNITLRVLPFSAGVHAATVVGFTVLDYPEPIDTPIVHVEPLQRSMYMTMDYDTDPYDAVWRGLVDAALTPEQSRDAVAAAHAALSGDTRADAQGDA